MPIICLKISQRINNVCVLQLFVIETLCGCLIKSYTISVLKLIVPDDIAISMCSVLCTQNCQNKSSLIFYGFNSSTHETFTPFILNQ